MRWVLVTRTIPSQPCPQESPSSSLTAYIGESRLPVVRHSTVAENVAGAGLDRLVCVGKGSGKPLSRQLEPIQDKPVQMPLVGLQNQYSWVQFSLGAPLSLRVIPPLIKA